MIYLCIAIACGAVALIGYCLWAAWNDRAELRGIRAREKIGLGKRA